MKGLEVLKDFQSMTLLTNTAQRKLKIIEKELKALEIIRKDAHLLHDERAEYISIPIYDEMYSPSEIYKLIKEVLFDET